MNTLYEQAGDVGSATPSPVTKISSVACEPPASKPLAKPKGERARNNSGAEVPISRLKAAIDRVNLARNCSPKEADEIADMLYALMFLAVDGDVSQTDAHAPSDSSGSHSRMDSDQAGHGYIDEVHDSLMSELTMQWARTHDYSNSVQRLVRRRILTRSTSNRSPFLSDSSGPAQHIRLTQRPQYGSQRHTHTVQCSVPPALTRHLLATVVQFQSNLDPKEP